jgi:hypothetical protein
MRVYYGIGMFVVYLGFALLLWEVCADPWLLSRSLGFQIAVLALVLLLFDGFFIRIVEAQAPIVFRSYAMRNGNYAPGTSIAGIMWNDHFTDLRIAVTNASDDEYDNFDLSVQPDEWSYKAAILNNPLGCELVPIEADDGQVIGFTRAKESGPNTVTSTMLGGQFDIHDSSGNVYTTLATKGGYRLICGKFPGKRTIQIAFAVVDVHSEILSRIFPSTHSAGTALGIAELSGVRSEFDLLNPRPSPSVVQLNGSFTRNFKPFKIATAVAVGAGN